MLSKEIYMQYLRYFLILCILFMIYIVVSTSLESNLFEQWDYLASIPWMRATLWDFYGNVMVIYLWVWYRERNIAVKLLWAVLFFCLGSIATIGYAVLQLFMLKPGEPVSALLVKKGADS